MNNRKMKPLAAAIGTAFAMSLTAGAVADEANPFEAQLIEDGTLLAAGHEEGGCGEDKQEGGCGEDKEGGCGEDKHEEGDSGEADAEAGDDAEEAPDAGES